MTDKTYNRESSYIKDNCEDFINEIYEQMLDEHWTWVDTKPKTPNRHQIRNQLFGLLDSGFNHQSGESGAGTGGLFVHVNDEMDRLECYFGHDSYGKQGISLFSPGRNNTDVLKFIDVLCKDYPILNKEYLINKYLK